MPLLPFISDEDLYKQVASVLSLAESAAKQEEKDLFKNALDPFSAIFDASKQNISLTNWMEQEKSRQVQKTLQNKIGEFHQKILGSMPGWQDLGVGQVVDLKNDGKKIIAEIKNKYNTPKGTEKISIYDNLNHALVNTYPGYMAYYVEVIPPNKKVYDKPFTPPDNKTRQRRPANDKIHVMDGKSFYALASGNPNALKMLYEVLPQVISSILKRPTNNVTQDELFLGIFNHTYSSQTSLKTTIAYGNGYLL